MLEGCERWRRMNRHRDIRQPARSIEKQTLILSEIGFVGVRTVLDSVDELLGSFAFESCATKEPRAERMLGLDLTFLGRVRKCGGTDAEKIGRIREIHPIS